MKDRWHLAYAYC